MRKYCWLCLVFTLAGNSAGAWGAIACGIACLMLIPKEDSL